MKRWLGTLFLPNNLQLGAVTGSYLGEKFADLLQEGGHFENAGPMHSKNRAVAFEPHLRRTPSLEANGGGPGIPSGILSGISSGILSGRWGPAVHTELVFYVGQIGLPLNSWDEPIHTWSLEPASISNYPEHVLHPAEVGDCSVPCFIIGKTPGRLRPEVVNHMDWIPQFIGDFRLFNLKIIDLTKGLWVYVI